MSSSDVSPCRCLVLGGGGAKGAFQVGALDYLVQACGLSFPLVTGVSVGALNGAILAQTPPDDLARAITTLKTIWLAEIRGTESVFLRRTLGAGSIVMFGGDSLYDNTPLRRLVQRYLRPDDLRTSPVRFRLGRVSLQSGKYVEVDGTRLTVADLMASTAFPYYFPPEIIDGEAFADGGLRNIAPVETAFDLLREFAPASAPRTIFAVLASPVHVRPLSNIDQLSDALKVLERAIEILSAEAYEQDLRLADDARRHANAVTRVQEVLRAAGLPPEAAAQCLREAGVPAAGVPPTELIRIEPAERILQYFDFSPEKIRQAMEHGYARAAAAVAEARARGVPL